MWSVLVFWIGDGSCLGGKSRWSFGTALAEVLLGGDVRRRWSARVASLLSDRSWTRCAIRCLVLLTVVLFFVDVGVVEGG